MAHSRLVNILYLYIQKGKYEMKTYKFQHDIRGTDYCMKRIVKVTNGCGKLSSNDTLFSDSWFSGVKIEED